jgi:hypothetical protein
MSIDIEQSILEARLDAREFVTRPPFIGSVWFTAGFLRSESLQLGSDPILPDNPHHGEAWGDFSKRRRGRLLKNAQWFVKIEGVDLQVE